MQLEPEADVGLVRAEAIERLAIGEAREGRGLDGSIGDGRPADGDGHRLDEAHHVGLGHEAHLQVQLAELGLAVAAQVLVAEAARDLEVAVHAGDHEQLLELLRALRQGVDAARLEARGHDEVAGPFGRRLDKHRRLDLHEAGGHMGGADGLDEPAAGQQAGQDGLAPQVQVAVLEAQGLVHLALGLVDGERRRARRPQHVDDVGPQFDVTGRQARVLRAGQPLGQQAAGADDELGPHLAGDRVGGGSGGPVEHDLGDAVAVAQVQEDQLAEVAPAVDPAGQGHGLAGRFGACFAARRGPVERLHGRPHGTGGDGTAPAAFSRGGGRPVRGSGRGPGRRRWPSVACPPGDLAPAPGRGPAHRPR